MNKNKYYVTTTDTFMSGWGCAKNKINKLNRLNFNIN